MTSHRLCRRPSLLLREESLEVGRLLHSGRHAMHDLWMKVLGVEPLLLGAVVAAWYCREAVWNRWHCKRSAVSVCVLCGVKAMLLFMKVVQLHALTYAVRMIVVDVMHNLMLCIWRVLQRS